MADSCLVLRTPSGISGDMLVTGFARLAGMGDADVRALVDSLGIPALQGCLRLQQTAVGGVSGWRAEVNLPAEHAHRSLADIRKLIAASRCTERARHLAGKAFELLAVAEAAIHGKQPDEVTFHEVGALDSILDISLAAAIFDRLSPDVFICSPLPVCDGVIECAHGRLAAPAPAVLQMLEGVPVYGIDSSGETVTPTAIALLKGLGATFAGWPAMTIQKTVRVFGGRVVPNVPNGALFVTGSALRSPPAGNGSVAGHRHEHVAHIDGLTASGVDTDE